MVEMRGNMEQSNEENLKEIGKLYIDILNDSLNTFKEIQKSLLETIKSTNIFEDITKPLKNIFSSLNDYLKAYREKFPAQEKLYDDSVKCGWIVPISLDSLSFLENLNGDELNKYYLKLYTRRNCEMLFNDLEQLNDNLNKEYKLISTLMIKTLKNDINAYPLMVSNLFALLDYMFVYQTENGNLRNKIFLKEKLVKDFLKEYEVEEYNITDLIYISCLRVIKKHIEYSSFEDEAIFNRHSIQHGRYFPSKISFADFIRLVNLCSTFSEFNTIYETEDNGILL